MNIKKMKEGYIIRNQEKAHFITAPTPARIPSHGATENKHKTTC